MPLKFFQKKSRDDSENTNTVLRDIATGSTGICEHCFLASPHTQRLEQLFLRALGAYLARRVNPRQ